MLRPVRPVVLPSAITPRRTARVLLLKLTVPPLAPDAPPVMLPKTLNIALRCARVWSGFITKLMLRLPALARRSVKNVIARATLLVEIVMLLLVPLNVSVAPVKENGPTLAVSNNRRLTVRPLSTTTIVFTLFVNVATSGVDVVPPDVLPGTLPPSQFAVLLKSPSVAPDHVSLAANAGAANRARARIRIEVFIVFFPMVGSVVFTRRRSSFPPFFRVKLPIR